MKSARRGAVEIIGWFLVLAYVAFGTLIGLNPSHWDEASTSDQVFFVLFSLGGALLLVVGLRLGGLGARWPAAVLISVGAIAGAMAVFWTLLLPLLAIALVVLRIRRAQRATAAES